MIALAKTLRDLFGPKGLPLKEFKPVAFVVDGMDMLLYLEKDCSYTSVPVRGSNISLLRENHAEGKIIGIEIAQFSAVADFDTLPKTKSAA